MPVSREISTWFNKDVAILIGEYARAADKEIVHHLNLCGKYESSITLFKGDGMWVKLPSGYTTYEFLNVEKRMNLTHIIEPHCLNYNMYNIIRLFDGVKQGESWISANTIMYSILSYPDHDNNYSLLPMLKSWKVQLQSARYDYS